MARTDHDLMATCWHEAGHAVIDCVRGLTVNSVDVTEGDDAFGNSYSPNVRQYHTTGIREQQAIARSAILATFAGIEAQRVFDPSAPESHGQSDFENADGLARDFTIVPPGCQFIGDDVWDAGLVKMRQQSRRLVKKHRHLIERVAKALFEKRRLTGDEVKALIAVG